jgi:hypothetical protein
LGDKIKEDERGGECGLYGIEEKCTRSSVVIPGEKEPLGIYKRRRKEFVEVDVKEIYGRT